MTITRRPLFVLGALAIVAATGIAALAHNGSAPRPTSPVSTAPVAAAPTVTAAAVNAVGNDSQPTGVNLFVGDPNPAIKAARTAPIADANARAQEWARLAVHHVGGLISLADAVVVQPGVLCTASCGGRGG